VKRSELPWVGSFKALLAVKKQSRQLALAAHVIHQRLRLGPTTRLEDAEFFLFLL
jgi:hypothetical protein